MFDTFTKKCTRNYTAAYTNRQAHDGLFFSHFSKVFCRNIKSKKKNREKLNFLLVGFTLFLSSRVFLSGIKMVAPRYLLENTIKA